MNSQYQPVEDEIDLRELITAIWSGRWVIIGLTAIVSILTVVIVLMMPNIYKSSVLLSPSEDASGGGLSALASQFGSLASLAGVQINDDHVDKTTVALEVLNSRQFIANFVDRNELKVPLMATKKWDQKSNRLIIDDDLYDEGTGRWVREVNFPYSPEPSDLEVIEHFKKNVLNVSKMQETGLVLLSVSHYSPYLAKEIASQLVKDLNERIRLRDIEEAEKSIEFLKKELDKTAVAEMQNVFYELIEQQTQKVMLANVRDQYVFKIVDPAFVPEEKDKPSRLLILALAILSSGFLGLIIVLVKHSFKDEVEKK